MDKKTISTEIDRYITQHLMPNHEYGQWRVGITHDIDARKEYHEWKGREISNWRDWKADSLKVAQKVETEFVNNNKCKTDGGTGGNMDPRKTTYVYVLHADDSV